MKTYDASLDRLRTIFVEEIGEELFLAEFLWWDHPDGFREHGAMSEALVQAHDAWLRDAGATVDRVCRLVERIWASGDEVSRNLVLVSFLENLGNYPEGLVLELERRMTPAMARRLDEAMHEEGYRVGGRWVVGDLVPPDGIPSASIATRKRTCRRRRKFRR